MKKIADILVIVLVIVVMSLVVWASVAAPCWVYKFTANKDVPARCISHFQR